MPPAAGLLRHPAAGRTTSPARRVARGRPGRTYGHPWRSGGRPTGPLRALPHRLGRVRDPPALGRAGRREGGRTGSGPFRPAGRVADATAPARRAGRGRPVVEPTGLACRPAAPPAGRPTGPLRAPCTVAPPRSAPSPVADAAAPDPASPAGHPRRPQGAPRRVPADTRPGPAPATPPCRPQGTPRGLRSQRTVPEPGWPPPTCALGSISKSGNSGTYIRRPLAAVAE